MLEDTAIDPIVQNAAEQLGYRAGLSVDTIVRTEFDANASAEVATIGSTITVNDFRQAKALLSGVDVQPRGDGDYLAIIHPYAAYDVISDNTAGGFIDITKYTDAAAQRNFVGEIGKVSGCRIVESTNVKTSGTAPNVLYYTYVVGMGAVGVVDLGGNGPSKVMDPDKQAFRINTIKGGPQIADPEGQIGSAVSYKFVFVAKTLDSTVLRYKMIKANSSII